jgi:hypothetical protein
VIQKPFNSIQLTLLAEKEVTKNTGSEKSEVGFTVEVTNYSQGLWIQDPTK